LARYLCGNDGFEDGEISTVESVEQLRDPLLGCAYELAEHGVLQKLAEVVYTLTQDGGQAHFGRELDLGVVRRCEKSGRKMSRR
jgi:hypothetical protein